MSTASCIKSYFGEVRSFEAFKYLHVGMVSDIKRKTLPAMPAASFANAKVVRLENHQKLHHFLTESPWDVEKLQFQRLEFILDNLELAEVDVPE